MQNRRFAFENLRVFFKHTDYYGYVHCYNYFEWTSYVREAFFQNSIQNFRDVLARPIKMMTVKIEAKLFGEAEFGDRLRAELSVGKIKKVSFDMAVRFINVNSGKLVYMTTHTIVFVDSQTGRFADIPMEMKNVIINYVEPDYEKLIALMEPDKVCRD